MINVINNRNVLYTVSKMSNCTSVQFLKVFHYKSLNNNYNYTLSVTKACNLSVSFAIKQNWRRQEILCCGAIDLRFWRLTDQKGTEM